MKLLLPLLLASAGAAQADKDWVFEPGQALVSVELGPTQARVNATSLGMTGRVRELDGGGVKAVVRLAAASFTTGSAERDRKLDRQGEIVFEGEAPAAGRDGVVHLKGTLTVRGVARQLEIPVTLVRAGGEVFCHASFAVDGARVDLDAGLTLENAVATRG